jgi:hypothetical protein
VNLNFAEFPFLGIWVNRASAGVPTHAGWHHARCRAIRRTKVGKEEETAVLSSAEENKAIVRRFLEELVKGNFDVIDELLAEGFVDRSLMPGQGSTREDLKRSVAEIQEAFSTTSFTIVVQLAEGETSENSVTAKFAEFLFHALGRIERKGCTRSSMLP